MMSRISKRLRQKRTSQIGAVIFLAEIVALAMAAQQEPVAGVGAGQAAQRHQPRHETHVGVLFAGLDQLVHLIQAREVVPRLGRGFVERPDRPAQIGQGFTDGNQLAAFTLHALFCHAPQRQFAPDGTTAVPPTPPTPIHVGAVLLPVL